MIVITTAGALLIERAHRPDVLAVHAQDRKVLEAVIDQLELVGTQDNPPALTYDYDDIIESAANTWGPFLAMDQADVALYLQAETLNFINYRKFTKYLTEDAKAAALKFLDGAQ